MRWKVAYVSRRIICFLHSHLFPPFVLCSPRCGGGRVVTDGECIAVLHCVVHPVIDSLIICLLPDTHWCYIPFISCSSCFYLFVVTVTRMGVSGAVWTGPAGWVAIEFIIVLIFSSIESVLHVHLCTEITNCHILPCGCVCRSVACHYLFQSSKACHYLCARLFFLCRFLALALFEVILCICLCAI